VLRGRGRGGRGLELAADSGLIELEEGLESRPDDEDAAANQTAWLGLAERQAVARVWPARML
jgi:hypothetical protein